VKDPVLNNVVDTNALHVFAHMETIFSFDFGLGTITIEPEKTCYSTDRFRSAYSPRHSRGFNI
jgi:hypothetical protein